MINWYFVFGLPVAVMIGHKLGLQLKEKTEENDSCFPVWVRTLILYSFLVGFVLFLDAATLALKTPTNYLVWLLIISAGVALGSIQALNVGEIRGLKKQAQK